jgi:PKD repeat protein
MLNINQNTTFTHRYNRSGNYIVTFTVTNEDGESETTSMTVNVNNGGWGNVY